MGQKQLNLFDVEVNKGQTIMKEVSTIQLKSGVYIVHLISGKEYFSQKLIITH